MEVPYNTSDHDPSDARLSDLLDVTYTEVFPGVLFSDGSQEEVVINGRRVSLVTPEQYEHYSQSFGEVGPIAEKNEKYSNANVVAAELPKQSISLGRSIASNPEYYGINKSAFYIAGQLTALLATVQEVVPTEQTNVYDFVIVRNKKVATLAPHTRFNSSLVDRNLNTFLNSFDASVDDRVSNYFLRNICKDAFRVGMEEWATR